LSVGFVSEICKLIYNLECYKLVHGTTNSVHKVIQRSASFPKPAAFKERIEKFVSFKCFLLSYVDNWY